jgi:two-component system alkaline phosphatase synthesis response regulator PhoP
MSSETQKHILVVDDEPDVRAYLRSALEDAGFSVETATDGLEALEMVRRRLPDLISLDLVMPGHSGARLYRELQKDKRLSSIPVLVVTGHARDELGRTDFDELTMCGPGVYLEKPVRPDSYVSAVRRLLGMENIDSPEPATEDLRGALDRALSGAGRDALERALEALRKK